VESQEVIARLAGEPSALSDGLPQTLPPATGLIVINDVDDLRRYASDLEDLVSNAEVQNVSYEPWILFPLLQVCKDRHRFVFVLIYDADMSREPKLIGFFPFERAVLHSTAPIPYLRLWADPFNYLNARCDPLIRKGHADCIDALLRWFAKGQPYGSLLNLRGLTEGIMPRTLMPRLERKSDLSFICGTIESHIYRRHSSASSYLSAVFSSKSLQTLRRYERRLCDLGRLDYADVAENGDISGLIDEFLELESQGWKGKRGVAVNSYGHRELVKGILTEAHRRKRLSFLTLRVGGRLIAARCVILARPGSFLFKLTYDESEIFAKRSPGLLLELEAIRRLHTDGPHSSGVEWLDTCASPQSPIFTRSRSEALKIHRFLVARKRSVGAIVLAGLRMMGGVRPILQKLRGRH